MISDSLKMKLSKFEFAKSMSEPMISLTFKTSGLDLRSMLVDWSY
jgi:hypothetical protein